MENAMEEVYDTYYEGIVKNGKDKVLYGDCLDIRSEFYEKDSAEVIVNSTSKEEAMQKIESLMLRDPTYKYLYEGGFIIKSIEEDDNDNDDYVEGFYHV